MAFTFFELFLLGRDMSVRANSRMSKSVSVRSGVPGGSVLGHLLMLQGRLVGID